MAMHRVTRDILEAALAGFRLEKQRIEGQIAEVQAMLDGDPAAEPEVQQDPSSRKRGKRSAAVRRRMAEAQKARWAKVKAASQVAPAKTKRKVSDPSQQSSVVTRKKRGRPQKAAPSAGAKKVQAAKSPRRAPAKKTRVKRSTAAVVAPPPAE